MRRSTPILSLLLVLGAAASPAAAANTADFQANCNVVSSTQIYCQFDARKQSTYGPGTHCDSGSITSYEWDFDDPNNDGTPDLSSTTSPVVSLVYDRGPSYDPSLTVKCSDGAEPTVTHCFPTMFGFNGCIRPNGTWTP